MMSTAWFTYPLQLHSSREFDCDGFTPSECAYYMQRWHFWYQADYVYALPTIAFFMCTIGIFIAGYIVSQTSRLYNGRVPQLWSKVIAFLRYSSYRGYHIKALRWNSAPIGVLMLAIVGALYFFCMDLAPRPYYWPNLNWGGSPPLGTRSGWLALACMPFVFATASKANWITLLTGVSYEKLNVFHRWISYAFFVLALMHTFPFIIYHARHHDLVMQVTQMNTMEYWTGIVALISQAWLTFASMSPLRNIGYEFFKASHFAAAIVFMITFFWHCAGTLTSWDYFIATAAIYVPCLAFAWLRTCFEYGVNQKARIWVEDNGFVRIVVPANFEWNPGQHCFLRFRGFGIHALTSHPFTICSLPSRLQDVPSELEFYIRPQGGITSKLYSLAQKQPGTLVPVLVDGPYGGIDMHKFLSSDRLVVIAGGSGAGWILAFIELFARSRLLRRTISETELSETSSALDPSFEKGDSPSTAIKARSMRVLLATRDAATRVWFHKTVNDLMAKYRSSLSPANLKVEVYLTGEASAHPVSPTSAYDLERAPSPSAPMETELDLKEAKPSHLSTISDADGEMLGRPQLSLIIREEAAEVAKHEQSLAIFACGPVTMQNDVRNAAAKANLAVLGSSKSGGVYLHLEHFSWA